MIVLTLNIQPRFIHILLSKYERLQMPSTRHRIEPTLLRDTLNWAFRENYQRTPFDWVWLYFCQDLCAQSTAFSDELSLFKWSWDRHNPNLIWTRCAKLDQRSDFVNHSENWELGQKTLRIVFASQQHSSRIPRMAVLRFCTVDTFSTGIWSGKQLFPTTTGEIFCDQLSEMTRDHPPEAVLRCG
jgi:hypothetical protein